MSKRKIDQTMTEARNARAKKGRTKAAALMTDGAIATEVAKTLAAQVDARLAADAAPEPDTRPTVAEWMASEDATPAAGAATATPSDAPPEPAGIDAHAAPVGPTGLPLYASPSERDAAKKAEREAAKAAKKAAREQAKIDRAAQREDLCVFALRMRVEERDLLHAATGPARASKFARALLVSAARGDLAAVTALVEAVRTGAAS